MIHIKTGNIFSTQCQTIVNTVNCVGVMGAGIALEFKLRYPKMFSLYQGHCANGQLTLGRIWIYNDKQKNGACSRILNFPTKNHWKDPSSLDDIKLGLSKFIATFKEKGITSIAFPLLGASLGGLSENDVVSLMKESLADVEIDIEIWHFDPTAEDDLYPHFYHKFITLTDEELIHQSGLNLGAINKIRTALKEPNINSLNGLLSVKGIGKTTVEKSFKFIMDNNSNTTNSQDPEELSLF
ncbi:macro domain-containing protein [Colwellia sp. BRX10-3]|uniref:macro domain-containing protein n=1 Tax=Colwellia sp. BRX10-3 TaxID=2759844 RepID=UPI0015F4E674|nr:macro domain-containing protein [Colwellia sp. BRX10-3]MBA6390484.1 macro domain-containing protein [Colwellia sp. BRX10-3]